MREIILASHGMFAEGAYDSANMIVGFAQTKVRTYRLLPGGSAADFAEELQKEIMEHPDIEYVVLTDLYGASVCNSMIPLSMYPNTKVFTGMNLCMVLEIIMSDPEPLSEERMKELVETAREGIRRVKAEITEQEDF